MKKLGHHVIEMFCNIDGIFLIITPTLSTEKFRGPEKNGVDNRADFGLAFDGDADRLGVVHRSGEIIWPDRQLIIFMRILCQERQARK